MNRNLIFLSCLILAGLLLSACGPVSIQLPNEVTIPTELPSVIGTVAAGVTPPSSQPTGEPGSPPVVVIPNTGNQAPAPTSNPGIFVIALIALIALVSVVAMFAMANRRNSESARSQSPTDGPPEGP